MKSKLDPSALSVEDTARVLRAAGAKHATAAMAMASRFWIMELLEVLGANPFRAATGEA